jgi:hypothetical protein
MLEKEKQLKINRLAQEVCALSRDTAHSPSIPPRARWSPESEAAPHPRII